LTHSANYEPRINNSLEGLHCKINSLLKRAHPNFFQILNIIIKVHHENEIDIWIFKESGRKQRIRSKYERSHQKIIEREKINC
jgi:hypothetical protein